MCKSLQELGYQKELNQLDFASTYYYIKIEKCDE